MLGAPEPIGVPTPEIVMGREIVGFFLPDRLIVDLQIRVVAHPFGALAEFTRGDIQVLVMNIVPSTKSTDRSLHNRAIAPKYSSKSE